MKNSCNRLYSVTALFFIFFLFTLSSLAGQEIRRDILPDHPRYGSGVASEDLPEIQVTALKDLAAAERWWYGWLTGYTAATAGQGVIFFISDSKTLRQDMALGAATTFFGSDGPGDHPGGLKTGGLPLIPRVCPRVKDHCHQYRPLSS